MWVAVVCLLVVSDGLGAAVGVRIYQDEKHAQEESVVPSADQEGSASARVSTTRGPGNTEQQHSFGVKIEHPLGQDLHGRVVEQKERHVFDRPTFEKQVSQHDFHPSQNEPEIVGGEWKGIDSTRKDQENLSFGHELSQHQVLGQVLQGLGQVNQILGHSHQGIEQVNQIFGFDHKGHQPLQTFTTNGREFYGGRENTKEEPYLSYGHQNLEDKENEDNFINEFLKNKDNIDYSNLEGKYNVEEDSFSELPKFGESLEENTQDVKTVTITKEIPVPYTVEVEKKVPIKVEVPVDKPYPVEFPKPYPVYVDKKVPYAVKEYVPQPYTVFKKVPYSVKVIVNKPYPVNVPKPYYALVEKKVPYLVEKHVPHHIKVFVDKPYPVRVPVFKPIPYTVEKKVPVPVTVPVEKPYPVTVPKPYKVFVEKKVPHTVEKPVPYPVHVPMYHYPQQIVEGSGHPVDQSFRLQAFQRPYPQGGEHPDQIKIEGSGLPVTVDQSLENHTRYPHLQRGKFNIEGSRSYISTDQSYRFQDFHRRYPVSQLQWEEHDRSNLQPDQVKVEGSGLPTVADQNSRVQELHRHHAQPQRGEFAPHYSHPVPDTRHDRWSQPTRTF